MKNKLLKKFPYLNGNQVDEIYSFFKNEKFFETQLKITYQDLTHSLFSSDLHLCHSNITEGTTKWNDGFRPFENPQLMYENFMKHFVELKKTQNKYFFYLGDFCMGGFELWKEMLYEVCQGFEKFFFIMGNHDKFAKTKGKEIQYEFLKKGIDIEFVDYMELKLIGGHQLKYEYFDDSMSLNYKETNDIILSHYPIKEWNHKKRNSMMIHGHSHNKSNHEKEWSNGNFIFDCGIDANPNYTAFTIHSLIDEYNNQIKKI